MLSKYIKIAKNQGKMENLTQWIVYRVLIAVSYMFVGCHIAQLSREIRKNWNKQVLNGIAALPLKLILYPIVVEETARGKTPKWLLYNDYEYSRPAYVILHLFLWPFRIAGNLAILVLIYLVTPVIALLLTLVAKIIVGAIEAMAEKIKGETSS